jgi:hypothetical protein
MSDRPRISVELVKPAGFRTQEKLRDRTPAGLWEFLTDEYHLTGSLTEEQKESFRDHPEKFMRALLQESGDYSYPINDGAVNCSASPPFSDECLMLGEGSAMTNVIWHYSDSSYRVM